MNIMIISLMMTLCFHQPGIAERDYEKNLSESKLKNAVMYLKKMTVLLENEQVKAQGLSYICTVLKQLTIYCEGIKAQLFIFVIKVASKWDTHPWKI